MSRQDAGVKRSFCRRIRIWGIRRRKHETRPPRIFGILIAFFYAFTLLFTMAWLLVPVFANGHSPDSSSASEQGLSSLLQTFNALPDLTRFRDLFVLIGAAVAVPALTWRTHVAQSQAFAAHFGRLNTTFREGIKMLGNQDTSVQIRGIYEMLRVVEEQPDMFHVGMMRHLCALLREQNSNGLEPRDDRLFDSPSSTVVAASLEIITSRSKKRVLYEQAADYVPDLRNVSLLSLELKNANFTNCILRQALFCGSQLAGADFTGSDVSDAAFSKRGEMPAMGLTGCQLALAYADPDLPPLLDGVKDEKTGENLAWKK